MYMKKTDELAKAKKTDEAKTARNMEKLEAAKEKYDAKLDTVVEQMKKVYGKRAIALKAAYVAYWSSQLRAFDLLSASLVETREFVSASVDPIRKINIGTISDADLAAFNASNCVPGSPTNKACATQKCTNETTNTTSNVAGGQPGANCAAQTCPADAAPAPTLGAAAPTGKTGAPPMSPIEDKLKDPVVPSANV
jgi:hypothetical protein